MFVYRVLYLEGNGSALQDFNRYFREHSFRNPCHAVNTYLQIPPNGERFGFHLSFYLPKLYKEKYIYTFG